MAIVLDEAILAKLQAAQVDINVHVTATINVTPFVARQKVNVLLFHAPSSGGTTPASGGSRLWGHLLKAKPKVG